MVGGSNYLSWGYKFKPSHGRNFGKFGPWAFAISCGDSSLLVAHQWGCGDKLVHLWMDWIAMAQAKHLIVVWDLYTYIWTK